MSVKAKRSKKLGVITRYDWAYSGIIQVYSGIFTTFVYSQPLNIQSQRHTRNPVKRLRWNVLRK